MPKLFDDIQCFQGGSNTYLKTLMDINIDI